MADDSSTARTDKDLSKQRRASNASDRDEDKFEDASDNATPVLPARPASSERSRSLTQRRASSTKSIQEEVSPHHIPPVPAIPQTDQDHTASKDEQDPKSPKSPLLSSHRLSNTSLDNVNLDEDSSAKPAAINGTSTQDGSAGHGQTGETVKPPPLPPKNTKSSFQGLSGVLPSVPWSPPPQAPPNTSLPAPAPPARKLTSPFSWLSRNTSQAKETAPAVQTSHHTERRNTASSIATISSNPEMMLSKLDEGQEQAEGGVRPARNSLKDRFKLLRMREEAGITSLGDDDKGGSALAGLIGRSASLGVGFASPTSMEEKELALQTQSPLSPGPTSPHPLAVNNSLAPGTVSGVSAGPSAMADPTAPVDWDLWQSVVYEGPSVVAKTSPEDLNRAIATGIPNAIRGVVWQVLAQSKNEELEQVYRQLLNKGTEKEDDRISLSSATTGTVGSGKEKEEITSSASSIHSEKSTPLAVRSSSPPSDIVARAQATQLAEKRKKAKDDLDSLKKLEKAIKRDMGARTSYSKFAASAGLQDGLFGVCKAYALFDGAVSYAQGMNFLIMPLLFNMPEEEAFSLLVKLMNQYHLRDLFIQDMPGLHKHLYQFERLLEDFEPALYCHLHRRQVTPHLYATQWFLTLFAYRFPLQLVLRIYDLILSEGLEAILKFGIVLMQKNAEALLKMNDMVALTSFLKDKLFDVYIDQAPSAGSILESGFFGNAGASIDKEIYRADQLVQDACAVKITPEILKTYTAEWEEKTRLEKEREAELESLKTSNNNLNIKVRRLEERVQEHDTEHAALATDLVRTKVENEELNDQNESLKTQVQELRRVIEKQPEEVEERLKSEMDRLLKRNQEVHEENTRLEEEMNEMEQTLVETKMQYAEVNSEFEALTRRFADMRRALGAA